MMNGPNGLSKRSYLHFTVVSTLNLTSKPFHTKVSYERNFLTVYNFINIWKKKFINKSEEGDGMKKDNGKCLVHTQKKGRSGYWWLAWNSCILHLHHFPMIRFLSLSIFLLIIRIIKVISSGFDPFLLFSLFWYQKNIFLRQIIKE